MKASRDLLLQTNSYLLNLKKKLIYRSCFLFLRFVHTLSLSLSSPYPPHLFLRLPQAPSIHEQRYRRSKAFGNWTIIVIVIVICSNASQDSLVDRKMALEGDKNGPTYRRRSF